MATNAVRPTNRNCNAKAQIKLPAHRLRAPAEDSNVLNIAKLSGPKALEHHHWGHIYDCKLAAYAADALLSQNC